MELPKLENCNKNNLSLLKRYEMIMKNRGITEESIKGMINTDMALFLRYINPIDLKDITNITVEDFLFYCQDERKNSAQAINRKFTSLNSFFKQMIKRDYLDMKNPMDKVDKAKERIKMRNPLVESDVKKIFEYIDSINDLRAGALFSLLLSSAIRLSELWQLNKNIINFENRTFSVIGKGRKQRLCIFSEEAKERLLNYLESRTDNLEPLFISREHNRLSKKAIQTLVKNTCDRAGVESHVFPHLLRHTVGSLARKAGVKIEDIALLLGHSNPSVTVAVYARGNLEEIQGKFDKLYN